VAPAAARMWRRNMVSFPLGYRGAQNAIAAPTLESFMRVACCMMPVQC
jgi:hypothetical protein